MSINNEYNMVKEFHEAFNHPYSKSPKVMDYFRAKKRYAWMKEEIDEFIEASKNHDIYGQADAMIDLIYFALGTMVEIGVEPAPIFKIVQEANMSKLWEDGLPHYNETGKVIKPEGWQDPFPKIKVAIDNMMKDNS